MDTGQKVGRAKTPCADAVAPRAKTPEIGPYRLPDFHAHAVAPTLVLRMSGKVAAGKARKKLLGEARWKGYTEGCEFPGNLPGHPAY